MGLGLTREKIGDILITPEGAQVILLRETLPILLSQWEKAGRYPVKLTPIPLDQLTPTPGSGSRSGPPWPQCAWTRWWLRAFPSPAAGLPT